MGGASKNFRPAFFSSYTAWIADGTQSVVTAVDPLETFAGADPALRAIAEQVRAKLSRALDRLA